MFSKLRERASKLVIVSALALAGTTMLVPQTVHADDNIYTDVFEFTNYVVPSQVNLTLIKRIVVGSRSGGYSLKTPTEGQFLFKLYKVNSYGSKTGDPIATGTTDSSGKVALTPFEITTADLTGKVFRCMLIETSDMYSTDNTYLKGYSDNSCLLELPVGTLEADGTVSLSQATYDLSENVYNLTYPSMNITAFVMKRYLDENGNALDLAEDQFMFEIYHYEKGEKVVDNTAGIGSANLEGWETQTNKIPQVDLGKYTVTVNTDMRTNYFIQEVIPEDKDSSITYDTNAKKIYYEMVTPSSGLVTQDAFDELTATKADKLKYTDTFHIGWLTSAVYGGKSYTSLRSMGLPPLGTEITTNYFFWSPAHSWTEIRTEVVTGYVGDYFTTTVKDTQYSNIDTTIGGAVSVFTNIQSESLPAIIDLCLKKELVDAGDSGRKLRDEEFMFVLYDDKNNVLGETRNDADGNIIFGSIEYTEEGTHHYKIVEVKGVDPHIKYDETAFEFDIVVTKGDDGNLTATIKTE